MEAEKAKPQCVLASVRKTSVGYCHHWKAKRTSAEHEVERLVNLPHPTGRVSSAPWVKLASILKNNLFYRKPNDLNVYLILEYHHWKT